ncbi:methylenetetrahydrofolate--tRNA-(uracil(54)-C(5))-methyltransferase (FADH(2)-oxidizing) TrmFO [Syntrophomonas erecta]
MNLEVVNVIGGGLAGCEAAYRIAEEGIKVRLWEMRPVKNTPVHQTGDLAELVCSNSLKSELEDSSQGLLKQEMSILHSLVLSCAKQARVPAGSALAVDRQHFSRLVTKQVVSHPLIEVIRQEVGEIPREGITVVATGPLTSDDLSEHIGLLTGEDSLYFYDAVAPSVTAQSLDDNKVFRASRYGKGSDDYLNCPLSRQEYERFHQELVEADVKEGHSIDKSVFFSGCTPIEVMARRGVDTLRFGPMRPVGLSIPGSEEKPYAVLQLRQEDREGNVFGLVGFQTRLRWREQDRILRLIPALKEAEFVRYGVMHRNTYINSPRLLNLFLQMKNYPGLFFAGQITGVEGYMESAATGIIAGINAARLVKKLELVSPGQYTMLGSLINFITSAQDKNFQPINANFGLLPPLEMRIKDKRQRYQLYVKRAWAEMDKFSESL